MLEAIPLNYHLKAKTVDIQFSFLFDKIRTTKYFHLIFVPGFVLLVLFINRTRGQDILVHTDSVVNLSPETAEQIPNSLSLA